MFKKGWLQIIFGILATLWGGGGLIAGTLSSTKNADTPVIPLAAGVSLGAMSLLGPSWRALGHKLDPGTFPPDTPIPPVTDPTKVPAVDLIHSPQPVLNNTVVIPAPNTATQKMTPKTAELCLFQNYQQLIEACEAAQCHDGMLAFHNGWNALFRELHIKKVEPKVIDDDKA